MRPSWVSTSRPVESMSSRPAGARPTDRAIIAATKLLEPAQSETLKLAAIRTEGTYEYVCTFPGHAVLMWGTLSVVK